MKLTKEDLRVIIKEEIRAYENGTIKKLDYQLNEGKADKMVNKFMDDWAELIYWDLVGNSKSKKDLEKYPGFTDDALAIHFAEYQAKDKKFSNFMESLPMSEYTEVSAKMFKEFFKRYPNLEG